MTIPDHCIPSPLPYPHRAETARHARWCDCTSRWRWQRRGRLDSSSALRRSGQQWIWYYSVVRIALCRGMDSVPRICHPTGSHMVAAPVRKPEEWSDARHGCYHLTPHVNICLVHWYHWSTPDFWRLVLSTWKALVGAELTLGS